MWWKLKLLENSEKRIVYAYSRETDKLDGVLVYDRETDDIYCERYAENDNESRVRRFLHHFYSVISEDPLPAEKMIAIG